MKRLSKKEQVDIVQAFTVDLTPAIELALKYGITRQGIYKVLKRHGVNPNDFGTMKVSCSACHKEIIRPRCKIRTQKDHLCSHECYSAFLSAGWPYHEFRHGGRIARTKVSEYFDLQPDHIVHHKDRNQRNNILSNLLVFANQGDHLRHHRGFEVRPLWDGAEVNTQIELFSCS